MDSPACRDPQDPLVPVENKDPLVHLDLLDPEAPLDLLVLLVKTV